MSQSTNLTDGRTDGRMEGETDILLMAETTCIDAAQ